MKKIMLFVIASLYASCFVLGYGNGNTGQDYNDKLINNFNDSLAFGEKAKQDLINSLMPEVKVNIYVRTEVGYDSEGWPIEMGKVVLIKDFQDKKEYQCNGTDYIEKIEIIGQLNDITLQFINRNSNKVVHEEKAIILNDMKTYTTTDPLGEKDNYFQEWLSETRWDGLVIKVAYKDKSVFEGKIIPLKN
jgi:hypothetical protein